VEDYAHILDYLPQGHHDDRRFKREPVALAIGESQFKLFELVPKDNVALTAGDRVYIGKEVQLRTEILHVKRRIKHEELTNAAQSELPFILQKVVAEREVDFVRFYNESRAITTRFHMLELLPGLGKKSMWAILEERRKRPFINFKDIEERVPSVHHPDKLIAKRIEQELAEADQKYHIFVAK
jgi:putative nucleotide binding protein